MERADGNKTTAVDWERVFDCLNEPVMILDPDGRIVKANKAMEAVLEVPAAGLAGRHCYSAVHGEDRLTGSCPLLAVKATGTRQVAIKNLKDRRFSVVVDPLHDAAGRLTGAVHVMYDFTAVDLVQKRDILTTLFNRSYFEARLARLEPDQACGLVICDIDGLKMVNDSLGFDQGNRLLVDVADMLRGVFGERAVVARIGEDAFAALLPGAAVAEVETACAAVRAAVRRYNEAMGRGLLSLSVGHAHTDALAAPAHALFQEAHDAVGRQKLLSTRSVRSATAMTVKLLLEARDIDTGQHSDRTQQLAADLARSIGLKEEGIQNLMLLGRFHDVGKIGVPDSILLKPARLTSEEFRIMTRHCELGYQIAVALPDVAHIADWILKHHERWDGAGYPLKLAGTEIPVECRLMAIVDAYDAMLSDRPYRRALSMGDAAEEIRRGAGSQFDPDLAAAFIKLLC